MTDRSVSDARKRVYRRRRIVVFSSLAVVLNVQRIGRPRWFRARRARSTTVPLQPAVTQ